MARDPEDARNATTSLRIINVGSARLSGSATTTPAGTSTNHRRERAWSDRTARNRIGTAAAAATTPAPIRPSASSKGPVATLAATSATATGTGPSNSGVGIRSGNRRSSPYASAFAAGFGN